MKPLSHLHLLLDPLNFARLAGFTPDPWQQTVLNQAIRFGILCCSRQSGKTTAVIHRAVFEMLLRPHSTVLIVSATETHSIEVATRIRALLNQLQIHHHKLPGRQHDYFIPETSSRFLALPCTETAARSLTATLILIDEAAKIPDKVWYSLAGTQAAVARPVTWLLSTPAGHTGFFSDLWHSPDPHWTRIQVPATECSRISAEFLAQKQKELPPWVFAQEFLCQFGDAARSVFKDEDIKAALAQPEPAAPRMLSALPAPRYFLGLDLGQCRDHSAICILEARHIPRNTIDPYTRQPLADTKLRLRWLERLPLDLPYPDVVNRVRQLVHDPEYIQQTVIILDATGGGNIFLDQLRAARLGAQIIPVSITAGLEPTVSQGKHNVPKHELVTTLEAVFREHRIGLDPKTPHLAALLEELRAFERLQGPRGRETFAGKASHHDDLVIALSLAVWRATQTQRHDQGIFRPDRLL